MQGFRRGSVSRCDGGGGEGPEAYEPTFEDYNGDRGRACFVDGAEGGGISAVAEPGVGGF